MITSQSIPYWPEGVELHSSEIADIFLRQHHDLNEISAVILKEVDGRSSILDIATLLCERYDWPLEQVEADIVEMVISLNQRYLINVYEGRTWKSILRFSFVSLLFFLRTLQTARFDVKKRVPLSPDKKMGRTFIIILSYIFRSMLIPLAILSVMLYGFLSMLELDALPSALIFFTGVIASFTLHEFAHAMMFIWKAPPEEHAFFAYRRGAFQIVKRRGTPMAEFMIALAGPLFPTIIGISGTLFFWSGGLFPSSWMIAPWIFNVVFTIHALTLFPPFADGKRMLEAGIAMRLHKKLAVRKDESV
ncbi:PqqD family peptide modification chaperone [Mechercharimyces sp. CAU 1602]|uniref:PqqD family peptide modification chaperone n=1 Tax=Mechercharimyces sp. CAU 1602 TaxID=2973933 RepID=UPI002163820D|nr:PqqD family peptide modification chaperone [Mechercharimyces sp. CAU 1602]MCS1350027.1 PqqD family peptide modification chaperone [Mechercharimyces sp. CAU 1602]